MISTEDYELRRFSFLSMEEAVMGDSTLSGVFSSINPSFSVNGDVTAIVALAVTFLLFLNLSLPLGSLYVYLCDCFWPRIDCGAFFFTRFGCLSYSELLELFFDLLELEEDDEDDDEDCRLLIFLLDSEIPAPFFTDEACDVLL